MKLSELENEARQIGVYVTSYAPGDGSRRIKFLVDDVDYFAATRHNTLYTAHGIKEASIWFDGFRAGRRTPEVETRREKNPHGRGSKRQTFAGPSWYAEVHAAPGNLLLGGVKVVKSSRFQDKADAESLRDTYVDTNERAGRKTGKAIVVQSALAPEITGGGD